MCETRSRLAERILGTVHRWDAAGVLDLDQVGRAAARVAAIGPLRHQPLEAYQAGMAEQVRAFSPPRVRVDAVRAPAKSKLLERSSKR